jgi:hypothetical protein
LVLDGVFEVWGAVVVDFEVCGDIPEVGVGLEGFGSLAVASELVHKLMVP